MRDYSHDTNFKDKPRWKRFLINIKWKYIKLDRQLHGRLTLILILAIFFAFIMIANRTEIPEVKFAREACWSFCKYDL